MDRVVLGGRWILGDIAGVGFSPRPEFYSYDEHGARATRTLIVLSPAFLEATFVQPEWASALRKDPTGMGRKLILDA